MEQTMQKPLLGTIAMAVLGLALLAGCEKKTTTVETPAGTTSTTTVSPTPAASQVVTRAGDAIADTAITAKVKTAFLADADVKGLQVEVDTRDGVVTLSGTLDKAANVDRAAAIAKGIEGVKSVDNRLTVKAP